MNVAILGPVYPYRGGIAHYTARLAREFSAAGHNVLVLNLSRQYPALLFPGSTQEDNSRDTLDVPCERIVDSMNPVSWARAVRRLRRARTQMLVIQWWHPYFAPSFGAIAAGARALGIEVVMLCHNVLPHESSPADRALARVAYASASRFVVHASSELPKLLQLRPNARVAVNPHPIYDQFSGAESSVVVGAAPAEGSAAPERSLLFFGLVRKYKGLDVLLRAMPEIHAKTGARLVVAGECYDDESTYLELARELNLESFVQFHFRYVANEDVAALMRRADAVVLPYRHATQSGVVQIAYAFGKPVITTNVGGLAEVVWDDQTGYLVPPENPAALAQAVQRFYSGENAARLQNGVDRAKTRFEWSAMVRTLISGATVE